MNPRRPLLALALAHALAFATLLPLHSAPLDTEAPDLAVLTEEGGAGYLQLLLALDAGEPWRISRALAAEAAATVGDEGAQRKRRRRPRKPRAEGVATPVETSASAAAPAEAKAGGETPKLRTRLKQKVKSFLSVFRGGRH